MGRLLGSKMEEARSRSSEVAPSVAVDSDAFICYSRNDRAFVERLHAALVGGGREVYVDWEDVPDWSPDYEEELYGGIDGSDSFLFVLSPNSLASPNCRLELDRAVAQGKRIRPLALRDAEGIDVPDALRKPQWIDFRRDEEFDRSAARLLDALAIDADWARRHTRVGLRAGDWERRGRSAHFLLRGGELYEAEVWLAAQAGKEPPPTELQAQYLLASRRATARRQRTTLAAVLIALAVAIVLAVLALFQRNQAVAQRNKATSLLLASASMNQPSKRVDIALLLALEAYRSSPTLEAENSMISALEEAVRAGATVFLHGGVSPLATTRDGRLLGSAGQDGTVRLWDLRAQRQVGEIRTGNSPIYTLAVSPNGQIMASGGDDMDVQLWDVPTHRRLGHPLRGLGGIVRGIAFSPDGRTVIAADEEGSVLRWDVRTRTRLGRPLRFNVGLVSGVAFSPDGHIFASATERAVRLWDLRTGLQLGDAMDGAVAVAFTPDGDEIATGGQNVRLWDVQTQKPLGQQLRGRSDGAVFLAFSRDGRRLVSSGLKGNVRVWDLRTLRPVGPTLVGVSVGASAAEVALNADGSEVASAGDDGKIWLWNIPAVSQSSRPMLHGSETIESVTFSRDGQMLASGGRDGMVRLWDVRSHKQLGQLDPDVARRVHPQIVWDVSFSPNGKKLVSLGDDSTIRLWDVRSRRQLGPAFRGAYANQIAFSPNGHAVASGGDSGYLQLWDTRTHEQTGSRRIQSGGVDAISFSPDGRTLAIGGGGGKVLLWSLRRHTQVRQLGTQTRPVWDLSFSPNGRIVAAAVGGDIYESGSVIFWDAKTGDQQGEPIRGDIADLVFSPDGQLLLTDDSATLRLWDVRTHKPLGRPLPSSDTRSIAFSPDGRTIAAAGNSLQLWPGIYWRNLDELQRRVCHLVWGHLTATEWAAYVPGLTPHATCET